MKEKKGISLIVLIVTIIVMIIIAGAVIISLTETNIIDQAETAVEKHNKAEIKSAANMAYAEWLLKKNTNDTNLPQVQKYIADSLVKQNVLKAGELNNYHISKTGEVEEIVDGETIILFVEIPTDNCDFWVGELQENNGDRKYTIDWGDNTPIETVADYDTLTIYHNYKNKGEYEIKITGEFDIINISNDVPSSNMITEVKSLGNMKNMEYLFLYLGDKVEYIPNINAEKLFDCSMTLEGVKELSDNLFIGSKNIQHLDFINSINLKTVSDKVFEPISNSLTDVDRIFDGCTNLEGNVPEFWNEEKYPNISSHTDWLKGVDTDKITNYDKIPDDWK